MIESTQEVGPKRPPGQRIAGRADRDRPPWLRLLQRFEKRIFGAALEPTRVWARAPAAMLGFLHFYRAVDRHGSPLDPALRSLVTVRVSQINACPFCVDINTEILRRRGVPVDKALAVASYESSGLFSPKERVALDYASAMTRNIVDDALFERLREHFDDDAIVELTAVVALQNASSKFNAALAIPAQGLCAAP